MAALNTRRESQGRARNDDDRGLSETTPPEVSACRDMFAGLPEDEIVKTSKNNCIFSYRKFVWNKHLHDFEDIRKDDSIVVENGSLKSRKTIGTYKDFGKSVNEVWLEAFLNYMVKGPGTLSSPSLILPANHDSGSEL